MEDKKSIIHTENACCVIPIWNNAKTAKRNHWIIVMRNRNVWKSKQITTPSRLSPLLPPPLYKHITYTQHISSLCYLHSEHHFDQEISLLQFERKEKIPVFGILFSEGVFRNFIYSLAFSSLQESFQLSYCRSMNYISSICKSRENADKCSELRRLLEKKISTH